MRVTRLGHLLVVSILYAVAAAGCLAQNTTMTISSNALGTDRAVTVRLPASYEESDHRYPVLYALDGDWSITLIPPLLDSLVEVGVVPEMILVAIPHPVRRRDLTPSVDDRYANSGGAESFLRFLADELIPHIDAEYRTLPFKVLYGHSLAGLFVTYALVAEQGLFDGHIASSPGVHWDNWYVRGLSSRAFEVPGWNTFYYMSIGTEDLARYIPAAREFAGWLEVNAPEGLDWQYRVYEGEDHSTMPPISLVDGLVALYSRRGQGGP